MSWFRRRPPERESVLSAGDSEADSKPDRVWLYQDGRISIGTISRAWPTYRTFNPARGEAPWFVLYNVQTIGRVVEKAHRSEVYLIPSEREHLIYDLEYAERRARGYLDEIEDRDPDYIPDAERDDI